MFSRISGSVIGRTPASVQIETGGLTYDIVLPSCVAEKIPSEDGAHCTLEILSHMTIDGNAGRFTFFGFSNAIEREFFEALTSVASIGPRSAARAFSAPMARIARAIDEGDVTFLRTLPGVGPQKAREIVAKLQGKVARFLLIQDAPQAGSAPIPDFAAEALAVLLQLAYKRGEAEAMIGRTLERAPDIADAETLLAEIYRRRTEPAGDAA